MSDDAKFDSFIAQMASRFVRDQAVAQAQTPHAEHTIENARPFPAGTEMPSVRDKTKFLA